MSLGPASCCAIAKVASSPRRFCLALPEADTVDAAADRRWRLAVQHTVGAVLAAERFSLAPAELRSWRQENDSEGAAIFRRYLASAGIGANEVWQSACASKGIPLTAIYRILGFGAAQTRALAEGVDRDSAYAGALFNLGIVLFDSLVDGGGEDAVLARDFDRSALERLAAGAGPAPAPCRSAAFDFFTSVAVAFFAALPNERLGGITGRLPAMLAAETFAAAGGGGTGRLGRWRLLRRKSVWPFLTLAEVGGAASMARAEAFGTCIWIVDDLWDAPEDWRSGTASRIWLDGDAAAALRAGTPATLSRPEGKAFLDAESRRLMLSLRRFAAAARAGEPRRCLGATIGAWISVA